MDLWNAFVLFLEQALLTLHAWTGNAGLAIIAFTVITRFLILPLTLKSLQSSRKIQELQPQLKELQRKHGKDPQKLNEETFKLYREYKVNPAGSCLPMLLQLPIFLGVYQAVYQLTRVSQAEHAAAAMIRDMTALGVSVAGLPNPDVLGAARLAGGFLWLPDMGKTDPLYILPILSVVLQLVVQLMATPRVQDPQQKAITQSMLIMPILFGYIGFIFPSGAVLYWVVGSVFSAVQQYVFTGWGSLANYLKFLPTDGGLFPHSTIPAAAAAGGGSVAVADGPQRDVAPPQRLEFWDVLKPLTEQKMNAEPVDAPEAEMADPETEQAVRDVKRQIGQYNPRRRRTRR